VPCIYLYYIYTKATSDCTTTTTNRRRITQLYTKHWLIHLSVGPLPFRILPVTTTTTLPKAKINREISIILKMVEMDNYTVQIIHPDEGNNPATSIGKTCASLFAKGELVDCTLSCSDGHLKVHRVSNVVVQLLHNKIDSDKVCDNRVLCMHANFLHFHPFLMLARSPSVVVPSYLLCFTLIK